MNEICKIGFGGGCHWCTEAVFAHLHGVSKVDQGWIASASPNDSFSEAVIVHFDPKIIGLEILIEIHLLTHASTSNHSMRGKYRSAVYSFSQDQHDAAEDNIEQLKNNSENQLITEVIPFKDFKRSNEKYQDYYLKNPDKPFCQTHIEPKLGLLTQQYKKHIK